MLVEAAAGGVGSLLVQLAKHASATVIAVARGEKKLDVARQLGADAAIDYSAPDWHERVLAPEHLARLLTRADGAFELVAAPVEVEGLFFAPQALHERACLCQRGQCLARRFLVRVAGFEPAASSSRTVGTAQDRRRSPRLLRLSDIAQDWGCTPRLLYLAAVRTAERRRLPGAL